MKINRNIYWLSGAPFVQTANVFAIEHGDGVVLIDCEKESSIAGLDEQLRYWDLFDKVTHVLVTHHHHDHAGNAKLFQDRGAIIMAPAIDAPRIAIGGFYDTPLPEAIFKTMMSYTPCKVDRELADGEEFVIGSLTFRAIAMPGHTAGSMFYETVVEGKTVLVTGDVTFPSGGLGTDAELCWKDATDYCSRDYVESLVKAASLQPDILLGGHNFPVLRKEANTLRTAAGKAWSERRTYV